MALLGQQYDVNALPDSVFECIPAGTYPATITSTEVVRTKDGQGLYLKLEYTIFGSQYSGRKVFQNINYSNPNQKAQEIGLGQLKSLSQACGLNYVQDSNEFLNRQVMLTIGIRQPKPTDEYQNPQQTVNKIEAYAGQASGNVSMAAPNPQAVPQQNPQYSAPQPNAQPGYGQSAMQGVAQPAMGFPNVGKKAPF